MDALPIQACPCDPAWYDLVLRIWLALGFLLLIVTRARPLLRPWGAREVQAYVDRMERRHGSAALTMIRNELRVAQAAADTARCRFLKDALADLRHRWARRGRQEVA